MWACDIFSMFGSVVPFLFQRVEIFFGDVSGDIHSIEDGRIKMRETGSSLRNGLLQILQILKDKLVGSNILGQLTHVTTAGDQLGSRRHIDSVDIGETHGWRSRTYVDLLCPLFPDHCDDLADRRSAHNGIVHQQHVLTLECLWDGVELAADRLPALRLPLA